jgi:hypothetical protein
MRWFPCLHCENYDSGRQTIADCAARICDRIDPPARQSHLLMRSAMSSRLEPFKKFVRMLRSQLGGILPWTQHRVSNGAVEGMNNKIESISHRSFGFRTAENFIANIYHFCARLPLPAER